jgi:hypothetical protein
MSVMSHANDDKLQSTKRLMGALLRMPPKPHSEMKLHKRRAKLTESPKTRRVKQKRRRKIGS